MNNSTCSSCGSSLGSSPTTKIGKIYCGFCEMFVIPSVNGERLDQLKRPEFISHEHIRLNTPQLMEMHTKSLLELLRLMREERRNYYNQMRILKRGAAEDPKFLEGDRMSSEEYELMTRKCFVVENIIRDRMGYIPKKITNNLLLSYEERCNDPYNDKRMTVNKPGPEQDRQIDKGISR